MNRIRGGLAAWSDIAREQGRDPEQLAQTMADDNARFDKLGIVLDCDARKLSQTGVGAINTKDDNGSEGTEDEAA